MMINKIGWIGGLAAGIAIVAGAALPAAASRPVAIEKELLGVRILQNYREVLLRYGAPTRIFRATETVNYQGATNLAGAPTGGILGIAGSTSSGSGGPGAPMMGGGYPGMSGGSKKMGGGSPYGGGGGPGGGPYGSGGGPGGGSPGAAGPGGAQGGDNPDASYSEAGGFTWVYLYPVKELAYEFHFNKDGRVEVIAELGRGFGQHTSRGVGLGDTLDKVYGVYGWTDQIKEEETGKFSLLYNDKYHAQFVILKNKIVGISVFLKESQYVRLSGGSAGGSGGGPAMPGMGGTAPQMGGGGGGAGKAGRLGKGGTEK